MTERNNAHYSIDRLWYTCWLIEDRHGTQPVWWSGAGWTTVANDAIWFARHCDAENIAMLWMHFGFPKDVVVCEHAFMLEKPSDAVIRKAYSDPKGGPEFDAP